MATTVKKREKIIDFAKSLYIQIDKRGEKKYNPRQICVKIKNKFGEKYTPTTIENWAEKYDWKGVLDRVRKYGIEAANGTPDNELVERNGNEVKQIYQDALEITKIGFDVIKKTYCNEPHTHINVDDALKAVKVGTDIILRLRQIPGLIVDINVKTDPVEYLKKRGIPLPDMEIQDIDVEDYISNDI